MDWLRTFCCLVVLLVASCLIYAYYVLEPAQNWDETFHVKSSLVSPSVFDTPESYGYATDHPSIKRYIYGWVLQRSGIHALNVPDADYSATEQWNIDARRVPPFRVTLLLRLTNALFVIAALVLVFFSALVILRNAWMALAVAAPLLVSDHIALGVVAYLGCDAILAFTIALALFTFVVLVRGGRASTMTGLWLIGAAGALAVSTKFNGALVMVAFCLYLVFANRGIDRVLKPLIAGLICIGIFVALNPVIRGGGFDYAFGVIWDMLGRRGYIWDVQFAQFPLSRASLVARFFPWTAFLIPLAGALVTLRRERWVGPVSLWCAVLIAGTLLSVNRTYARYFLPVEMATFFLAGVAAWRLVQGARQRAQLSTPVKTGAWPAAVTAVAACCVLALSAAVIVPLGALRVHGGSIAGKARLFILQSRAYYGGVPVAPEQAHAILDIASAGGKTPPPAHALLGPLSTKVLASAALASAVIAFVVLFGGVLDSIWLGAVAVCPFLWVLVVDSRYQSVSLSESVLLLSACVAAGILARPVAPRQLSWSNLGLVAFFAALSAAASPSGILVAAFAAAWLARDWTRVSLLQAASLVGVTIALFAILEPVCWYLGAGETSRWVMSVRSAALDFWVARFADMRNLLQPVNECFPWWPMLPLASAVLYAARQSAWNRALSVWFAVSVSAAFLTAGPKPVWRPYMDLTLAAVCGVSGLVLISQNVLFRLRFREQAGQA